MNDIINRLKKNKIQILKIIITMGDLFFLLCAFFHLVQSFSHNYFMTLTIFYLIILIICALISEFSPYILHNYFVGVFPFLTSYAGRAAVYIITGSIFITPEVGLLSNYAGIGFLIIGGFCVLIHFIINSNFSSEHQDIIAMKNNYDDFSSNSLRESLNFPKGERNSQILEGRGKF